MPQYYEEKELKHLQKLELGIYKEFKRICDENKLTYFGYAGTGIGALRHGGFIPWDDDIDIFMPRRDYEKFVRAFNKQSDGTYRLMCPELDKNYPLNATRMVIDGTKFVEKELVNVGCDFGIYMDIFILDNAADNPLLYQLQMWSSWIWGKLFIVRSVPKPVLYVDGFKAKLAVFGCKTVNKMLNAMNISSEWIYKKRESANRRYSKKQTKRIGYFCDPLPYKLTFEAEDIYPLRYLKFEDTEMPFPNHLEKYLTMMYGDYMQLPPEEKRRNHCPHILDFGKYAMKED